MFEPFKKSIDINKASYIYNKHKLIEETIKDLPDKDPLIKVFQKHKILMEQDKFNWIHEADIENLNFPHIKIFLKNFLICFSRDTDKQFGMSRLFKEVFPLDFIFLYFKNLNLSFGNKVYDESLRFKTQLLICFQEFYLNADFIHNFKIKFDYQFDFNRETRNRLRRVNRDEIINSYENDNFSLKSFIFFLLDNYYPRVGWRWIGASHFVYYLTLSVIVNLFELGYWQVEDFDKLLLKLYEISEVLVSLEKNSAKDSDHLAENFNKELIQGFSTAREQLTLIIIHAYQLLIDQRIDSERVSNYKYIFNSTKIKSQKLRNRNHLRQILFYLNSSNFDYQPSPFTSEVQPFIYDKDLEQMNVHIDKMYSIILENNLAEEDSLKYQLYEQYFDAMKIFFAKYSKGKVPLENLIASKILKKIVPLIAFLKNTYNNEVESLIDLIFCMINQLCVIYPELFESDYFKTIVKDFFEIEPFKNLYTIQKLVTEDNLKLNNYFLDFLTNIFIRNFENMMKIFQEEPDEINSNHEIFLGIIELFIKYFDHFNEVQNDNYFMELKMLINSKIEQNFLNIFVNTYFSFTEEEKKYTLLHYKDINTLPTLKDKLSAVRVKEAYLLCKLYNITIHNTYKLGKIEINQLTSISEAPLGNPLSNELMKLFTEIYILPANNLIIDRLEINKSQYFILMEKAFPITDKETSFLFTLYERAFDIQELSHLNQEELKKYMFEVSLPSIYKFIYAFVYLNDDNKVFDFEKKIEEIIKKIMALYSKIGVFPENEIEQKSQEIMEQELDKNSDIYQILKETQTSYTNHAKIKHIFYNLIYFIKSTYDPQYLKFINGFNRQYFKPQKLETNFGDNLVEIMRKTEAISQIDSEESMKNMVLFCIEEFRSCSLSIKFTKYREPNSFVFLRSEYFDLLCMLRIIFEKSIRFKKIFIDQINQESVDVKTKFFTKFWIFYRDSIFFSSYNFFHNNLWNKVALIFQELSQFMLQLTNDDLGETNSILQYFFNFKLVLNFNNNHVLYFQIYVILECLGNYNKLLHLKDIVRIEQKETIFFVIQNLFQVLSNILKFPEAQQKIYVYRIDIWMNLLIRNIDNLKSPFYDLKNCLTDYFLSIAGGEKAQIVKFYGANVNPEILKSSINKLFELLLIQYDILDCPIKDPLKIHNLLSENKIYKIIQKKFQFYNILIRYDVQTNYLNSFMERQIETLNKKILTTEYLIKNNLLWFYYATRVYTQCSFMIDQEKYNISEILQKENQLKVYPLLIDLIKKKEIKLIDLLNHYQNPNETNIEKINQNLSIILQTQSKASNLSKDKMLLLEKVKNDDFDWIMKNILN